MQDRVFAQHKNHIVDFAFNEDVVDVFPDMIRRSVPGYELVIPMGGLMAARHMGKSGTAFDLGCSLGQVHWPCFPSAIVRRCALSGSILLRP